MPIDIDRLLEEDISLKNEMQEIFKQLEDGYDDTLKVYEKFEKPLMKISESLKLFAQEQGVSEESSFTALAQKYDSLLAAQKQLIHDITDDTIITMRQIVQKAVLLNDTIKELNNAAKNARKIKNKIDQLDQKIEVMHSKGKPEKVPGLETQKQAREAELNLAKDKLNDAKQRYDDIMIDFNAERNEILKDAMKKLAKAESKYIEAMKEVIEKQKDVSDSL